MATCQRYNCDELPTYDVQLANCSIQRKGGSSQAIFIACGITVADPSDETEIQGLINSGDAWLIENVKIGLSKPTPETVAPVTSCGVDVVVNNVYTGTVFDAKVSDNNTDFWGVAAAGYGFGGLILKVCTTTGLTDMQIWVDAEISVSGGLVLPDTNSDVIRYEMDYTFKALSIETMAANPIFD